MWADDLIYITNRGAVMDKARVARQDVTDQVHVESLEVAERKVTVYGDVAVVTALERMRASYRVKLVEIPNVGHALLFEQPERVPAEVVAFLKAHA